MPKVGHEATCRATGMGIFAGHPLQRFLPDPAMSCLNCAVFALFGLPLMVRPFRAAMVFSTDATTSCGTAVSLFGMVPQDPRDDQS